MAALIRDVVPCLIPTTWAFSEATYAIQGSEGTEMSGKMGRKLWGVVGALALVVTTGVVAIPSQTAVKLRGRAGK